MDELCGYIERITFQNPDNGFSVLQLKVPKRDSLVCVVGNTPGVQPGETVFCQGYWKQHVVHGSQFELVKFEVRAPADLIGIEKYLGSGLVKGIGKVYAGRIVAKFGIDTLNIIDQSPDQLSHVPGLGKKRIGQIKACWAEQKSIRAVMIFLQAHGVSPSFAQKIFKTYGDQSIEKVRENPFNLAKDIFGIGFLTADKIAKNLGIAHNSPQRIDAGIEYALYELSNEGHVCYPLDEFLEEAAKMLGVGAAEVSARIGELKESIVVAELGGRPFVWVHRLYLSEEGIASEILRLKRSPCALRPVDTLKALSWAEGELKMELAKNQKAAVAMALEEKVVIITGGPGTGKSTITKAILRITEKLSKKIILAAPTGRAAKRMTEITGQKASTIHSLLEFDFKVGNFKRNRQNPLDCDLIVVDEASMIDTVLMYCLLRAIPSRARVIFVGDIHQLPSVGAGNVLKDMIQSEKIFVQSLNEIFRQAAGSKIITNAHRINQGIFPDLRNGPQSDFYFIAEEEPEKLLETLINLVAKRLPGRFKLHPYDDIQLLAPMRRGVIGTENLNAALQKALNKNTPVYVAGRHFALGDKVMQIRNNYTKEVYNGDIGRIVKIDMDEHELLVKVDERIVAYDFTELDELVLAYAVSIHKYQGSECPCVVIPVHTSHFKMLHRNLLYTGVTRGKRLVVLVGTKKAIAIAVKNDEVKKRYTGLKQALLK
jgi:exodeoxyribonuclease V alpha subunit